MNHFPLKMALCLTASMISFAAAASDYTYDPYAYSQPSTRDNNQFADVQLGTVPNVPPVAAKPAPHPQDTSPQEALFHFNNTVWVGAGVTTFEYKESVKPIPDTEHGLLPSFALGGDFMSASNLYASLEATNSFGTEPYNGALLNSPGTHATGTTSETVTTADGQIGQGFAVADNAMFIPYAELGYRYWNRNLGLGEVEDYHNFDMLGGIKFEVTPVQRLFLSAYGSGGTTLGGRMDTGGYGFELGNSGMYKVGGKVAYDLSHRMEAFATVDYDHFRYGHSPVIDAGGQGEMEPGSGTYELAGRVGIGYHFR